MMPEVLPIDPVAGSSTAPDDAADRQRLFDFLKRVSDAVHPYAGRVRRLLFFYLLSACWITYYAHLFFPSSIWFPVVLLVLLCLPAGILLLLYMCLASLVALPGRVNSMGSSIRTVSGRFRQRLEKRNDPFQQRPARKTFPLFKLGRTIADVREVLFEVPGAFDLWGSIVMLASPFFLVVAAITVLICAFLIFAALLTLIIHIL